jgi:hypothetical protein
MTRNIETTLSRIFDYFPKAIEVSDWAKRIAAIEEMGVDK